jgi:hypothetical protein
VPNGHAENAGARKRRYRKSLRLDPSENTIDVAALAYRGGNARVDE